MPKEWKKPKPTESERRKAASDAKKTIARNKKARHVCPGFVDEPCSYAEEEALTA